jgi:signal recognition particle subunit SRP54
MKKIPGVSQMMAGQEMNIDDGELKHIEAIIYSMTPHERQHPKVIAAGRRRRIADGSGTTLADVNRLLKDFDKSRKLMKDMMKRGKRGMFGGGKGMPRMGMN